MPKALMKSQFAEDGRLRAINLNRPYVTIEGCDFFGRKAWVHFVDIGRKGWWQEDKRGKLWKIYPRQVVAKSRRLCLTDAEGKVWMNCPEHITALRVLGLDRVAVSCGPGNWPPYLLPGELWQELTPNLEQADYCLEWKELPRDGRACCKNSSSRGTFVRPAEKEISLWANIDYGNGIKKRAVLQFNNLYDWEDNEFIQILFAPAQGWPLMLYKVAKFAGKHGWPHTQRVCWPQQCVSSAITAELFIQHRFGDMLGVVGAMSLIDEGIVACQVLSHQG